MGKKERLVRAVVEGKQSCNCQLTLVNMVLHVQECFLRICIFWRVCMHITELQQMIDYFTSDLSSSWDRGEITGRGHSASLPAIGCCGERTSQRTSSECPLVAKHSDDGRLVAAGLWKDQRVCFCTKHHCRLTRVNTCVCTLLKSTEEHPQTRFNSSSSGHASGGTFPSTSESVCQ